jgi:hypothetical protein
MQDYSKGKIYSIRCRDDSSLLYVDSTTQQISQRWQDHKSTCNYINSKKYDRLLHKAMRENGQDKLYIELYEEYPCEKIEQLNIWDPVHLVQGSTRWYVLVLASTYLT